MKYRELFAAGLLIAATTVGAAAPAHAAGRDLAVLVVGNGADKDLAARERAVIENLTRLRLQRGWNHKILPIYSYHFDKNAERSYCEERLKVKSTELVLVGLVELESGVPIDLVYRESDVANAGTASEKVMDRARTELTARGRLASLPSPAAPSARTAPPSPPARSTPSVATTPSAPSSVSAPAAPRTPASPPAASASAAPRPAASSSSAPVASAPRTAPSTVAVTTAPITPVLRPATSSPRPAPPPGAAPATSPASSASPATRTPAPAAAPASPAASAATVAVNPATTTPAANEIWAVQLGLFSTLEKARLGIEKLRQSIPDLQAEIRKGTKDGQVVYRVMFGSFPSQAEAYARAKSLAETGVAGFSVRIDPSLGILVK